ncbi:tRNA 2-thiouridine(34) synthase MnmA [Candidatus Parcubacteria bacterium]|nr:tRNA 2-thiouridine(34) synthase MnmA [Candidatus Parcubacteria bacterium]
MDNFKKKVFVGLSGGVDSAVSAALLKEQGYDVTGVFIKVWQPDFLECTWREERRDAMRVAARLNIPFLFFDFEEEYKRGVADYMIEEYRKGRTPNPDVMCNREIKFGAFWKKAHDMGADFIATGHYAQIYLTPSATRSRPSPNLGEGKGVRYLLEGADKEKDQSYFLWTLTQEDLRHVLFPVGHLQKSEVRKLAEKFNLPVAEKKDSQGICFLGQVDLEDFLSHYIDISPGDVLDVSGEVIGKHKGALIYTLGERHGFEIFRKTPDSRPYYVVDKDAAKNIITVSNNQIEINSHLPREMKMKSINWIQKATGTIEARIRYRQKKFPVTLEADSVTFSSPQTAASGQSIVFYDGELCLGGAILD